MLLIIGAKSFVRKNRVDNGKQVWITQLPEKTANWCNDIAVANDAIYLTDSASNWVFKADKNTGSISPVAHIDAVMIDGKIGLC